MACCGAEGYQPEMNQLQYMRTLERENDELRQRCSGMGLQPAFVRDPWERELRELEWKSDLHTLATAVLQYDRTRLGISRHEMFAEATAAIAKLAMSAHTGSIASTEAQGEQFDEHTEKVRLEEEGASKQGGR